MIQRVEICEQCLTPQPVNSRHLCPTCVFRNNHDGKNQAEVYRERSKMKDLTKVIQTPIKERKPVKRSKNNSKIKSEKLEKIRERIRLDEEFYEYIFNTKDDYCEECFKRLPDQFRDEEGRVIMRSQFSHILGKGAYPEFRHHHKNMNRICQDCHSRWEFGDGENMKIYEPNQILIQEMFDEKNKLVI